MLIEAPLKVNLSLKIVGKLKNGYHELRSLFHSIRIFDEIQVDLTEEKGIKISCNLPEVPVDNKNTVFKAAKLVIDNCTSYSGGLDIKIQKVVFPGTGLGAGSSDAGAVLYVLQKEFGLEDKKILEIAGKIGADVPFCFLAVREWNDYKRRISGKIEGIGDKIDLQEPLKGHFVILIPENSSISTPDAFNNFDIIADYANVSKEYPRLGYNDFERILDQNQLNKVNTAKEILRCSGAEFALMTGSGSSIVGYFKKKPDIIKKNIQEFLVLAEKD
ncbi:4-(cytidine 5'-diphospho)-2-C-methyl-D-erythritol kinase [bacterium]|nr:4-(cytidine 5'-diphospho)-2-C-methyl-D-erythritol kinase [bacterium]